MLDLKNFPLIAYFPFLLSNFTFEYVDAPNTYCN